jgi:hypothetical protein
MRWALLPSPCHDNHITTKGGDSLSLDPETEDTQNRVPANTHAVKKSDIWGLWVIAVAIA